MQLQELCKQNMDPTKVADVQIQQSSKKMRINYKQKNNLVLSKPLPKR